METYWLYGTLYPEIRDASVCVGYDEYFRYALGDTILVYRAPSCEPVPATSVGEMRIRHIGSRGVALAHLPGLLVLIGGGFVWWRYRNRRRS